MLVSIIVPVYNTEEYLSRCFESILAQTYSNFELIIVDDGSTDCSLSICRGYSEKDKRIRIIESKNFGVSHARNLGLEVIQGDAVLFLDSDDWIDSDYIERLVNQMQRNNLDVAICGYTVVFGDAIKTTNVSLSMEPFYKNTFFNYLFEDDYYRGYLVNKLIRYSIIKENNIKFHEYIPIMEDAVFLCEVASKADRFFYDYSYHGYNYVQRSSSAINSKKFDVRKLILFDVYKIILEYLNKYAEERFINNVKYVFLNYASELLYQAKLNDYDYKRIKKKFVQLRKEYLNGALRSQKFGVGRKVKLIIFSAMPITMRSLQHCLSKDRDQ